MHILLRGSLAQRLRIASGLMLFASASQHPRRGCGGGAEDDGAAAEASRACCQPVIRPWSGR